MLNGLEAINLQSFNWLNVIPADLLVLANEVSWPLDASHSCHKWLCEAAPWSYWHSQEQKFLNQFQFSSWQPYSDSQKTTLLLFLCSFFCLLAFTGWSSRRPSVRWSLCLFQLTPLSWMKMSTFHTLKKKISRVLICWLFNSNVSAHFWISASRSEELGKLPLSSLQNSANALKNQQCWFRESVLLFDI